LSGRLSHQFDFDGANLVRAIDATFRRRLAVLPNELPIGLSIEFVLDAGKLSQWDAFVRRSRLDTKEINLETLVKVIADFMMPSSIAAAKGKAFLLRWTPRWAVAKYDDYSLLSVSTTARLHFPLLVNCKNRIQSGF
jgi:hypothetical protein